MLQIFDIDQDRTSICAMKTSDGTSVYVSFTKCAVSFTAFIGKEAAREFAESILDIVEEMPDTTDHSAQTTLQFNEHREAA